MAKAAWTRKEGKNPKGGLNQKGRDSYNKETGGNLKPPSKEVGNKSSNNTPVTNAHNPIPNINI